MEGSAAGAISLEELQVRTYDVKALGRSLRDFWNRDIGMLWENLSSLLPAFTPHIGE